VIKIVLSYFFDAQLRRYILQSVRVFTGFQWRSGVQSNGLVSQQVVPATYAQRNRLVSSIIANNSTNTILAVPQITVWIKELAVDRQRTQSPNFIGKLKVQEREFDPNTQQYTGNPGYLYQVDRYMPRPYDLTLEVDIWTSNELQKQQILEQILILFDPAIDLQIDVNALDWGSLTIMELISIQYSSQSISLGTSNTYDTLDICTLLFKVPIWLSPPAQIKKTKLIREIITNVVQADTTLAQIPDETGRTDGLFYTENQIMARIITTYSDYKIQVNGNSVTLLTATEENVGPDGNLLSWPDLLQKYGQFRPNISILRLKTNNDLDDPDDDITGVIQFDPNNVNNLIWTANPDTLPQPTLPALTAIIQPHETYPGHGLPDAAVGQYYLMLEEIGTPTVAWGGAHNTFPRNAIITYNGSQWIVVFDPTVPQPTPQYVLNSFTNTLYRFDNHRLFWHVAYAGTYTPGYWMIDV
jgi:hypothetical protein